MEARRGRPGGGRGGGHRGRPQRMLGADDRREGGGGGKNNNGRTAPAAGQGKIAVLANLWARHFFWNSFFRQSIGKNIYVYAFFGEPKLRQGADIICIGKLGAVVRQGHG